jgi:hypothetical protein
VRLRVAEVRQDTVTQVLGDETPVAAHFARANPMVRADHLAKVLGVKPGGKRGGSNKVAEHDR